MSAADSRAAIANLCAGADRVLLSSSPFDYGEPTHLNVQPPEQWSALMASHGFVRDLDYDASYLTPWATLYVRIDKDLPDIVRDYDRSWWRLQYEVHEVRAKLLELHERLGQAEAASAEAGARADVDVNALQEEVLRLRDELVGKEGELGTANGRVAELEAYLQRYEGLASHVEAVHKSRTWRLAQALGTPVRLLRSRSRGE
jgi:hypothetical protein